VHGTAGIVPAVTHRCNGPHAACDEQLQRRRIFDRLDETIIVVRVRIHCARALRTPVSAALEIALRAEIPLKIAAKVDRADKAYYESHIKPLLNSDLIEFVGEISDLEKNEFFSKALAFLFPINWSEPFGIVLIESLACGVPVVAFPLGSVPEIVEDGVSGFLVNNVDEAVTAIKNIGAIDRRKCREAFELRFSAKRMAQDYLSIYQRIAKPESETLALTDGDLRWMKLEPPSSTT